VESGVEWSGVMGGYEVYNVRGKKYQ